MFDGNHNFIMQYLISVRYQVIFFAYVIYFKEIFLELSLNSYKVGIIFATHHRIRAKWKC